MCPPMWECPYTLQWDVHFPPQNCLFPWEMWTPIQHMVPWAHTASRLTDQATQSVTIHCIYIRSTYDATNSTHWYQYDFRHSHHIWLHTLCSRRCRSSSVYSTPTWNRLSASARLTFSTCCSAVTTACINMHPHNVIVLTVHVWQRTHAASAVVVRGVWTNNFTCLSFTCQLIFQFQLCAIGIGLLASKHQ